MSKDDAFFMILTTLVTLVGIFAAWVATFSTPVKLESWLLISFSILCVFTPTTYWYVRATSGV